MSDGRFTALIDRASAGDTYFFTRNQLYVAFLQRTKRGVLNQSPAMRFLIFPLLHLLGIAIFYLFLEAFTGHDVWLQPTLFYILIVTAIKYNIKAPEPMAPAGFEQFINKWLKYEPIPRLLGENLRLKEPPPDWEEADIYDYGVESVLVVDEDELVDLFVLNNFHAEQRCAVISKNGYPDYIKPRVKALLSAKPDLPVFVLHRSDSKGIILANSLAELDIGVDDHPVTDLGWGVRENFEVNQLAQPGLKMFSRGIPVDVLLPKRLFGLVSSAMNRRVPVAVLMGTDMATSWSDDGDRTWLYVSDFG